MQTRCSIDDCPAREVIGLVANKWSLLVIHALSAGTLRFGQLRAGLPGVTHKVLTAELRELERSGLVARVIYPEVPPRVEYSLTDLGASLLEVIAAVRGWAERNAGRVRAARAMQDERRRSR